MPDRTELPLFLLHTVLFPGGHLPLRVFEPRYLDMLCRCMGEDAPFGVVLIQEGREVGAGAIPYTTGTLAKVVDWKQGKDGILEVVARGLQRFRVVDYWSAKDQLTLARIETVADAPGVPIPFRLQSLSLGLGRILAHLHGTSDRPCPKPLRLDDAEWVGLRLAEVLPLPLSYKQDLLE